MSTISLCFLLWAIIVLAVLLLKSLAPKLFINSWLLLVLATKKIIYFSSFKKSCKILQAVPEYRGHWLYGSLFLRQRKDYQDDYLKWAIENDHNITKEWIGPVLPCVNIHHPHLIMNSFKTSRNFSFYRATCPWIGRNASTFAVGKSRLQKQQQLAETFSQEVIKSFTQTYTECTNIMITEWDSRETKIVCLHDDISKLVLDILLRCLYSHQSDCQTAKSSYARVIESVKEATSDRLFTDLYPLSEALHLYTTYAGWKLRRNCSSLHKMTRKFISEHRSELQNVQNSSNMDLLDSLLVHDAHKLTDLEIQNEMDSFLFWGLHNTSTALCWTLYCLAKHPAMQSKCRKEVAQSIGSDYLILHEKVAKFKYISWFIKETLRCHPPMEEVFRKLATDTMIGDHLIPQHTTLCFKIKSIHMNPSCWDDPQSFDPLRFDPSNSSELHPYAYLPFSFAPRNCVGEEFTMNILIVVTALILRKYELHLTDEHKETDVKEVMLTIKPV